jgi:hypothetical protein
LHVVQLQVAENIALEALNCRVIDIQ